MTPPNYWIVRTLVCRRVGCGGGWWGRFVSELCPRCGHRLTELAPVRATSLRGVS